MHWTEVQPNVNLRPMPSPVTDIAIWILLAPLALVVVALVARFQPGPRPRAVERGLTAALVFGVVVALAAFAARLAYGPIASPLLGADGLGVSVRLDGLSVTIFAMVSLLGLAIGRYSRTYLDGDPRHGVFLGRLALTAAAVEVLVVANNLALFLAAWVATSLCLHGLLVFYRDRPRAHVAAKKKFVVARLGDLFLAAAFLLIYREAGTGDLGALARWASTADAGLALELATAFIAATAVLKSAQFPTHGWLVEVVETPTPVSALLHAGILNAGPFLVLRFAPVMELGHVAPVLLVVVGGFTAIFASVVLRTQTTVKVALGYSSAAHMGFMLLVCGLGVYPAAVLHLVAHSFYKAHAFLSSGSVVDAARAQRVRLPPRAWSFPRAALGLAAALALYVGVAFAFGMNPWEHASLLALGAILTLGLFQLLAAGFDARISPASMAAVAGLATCVAGAFFGLEELARLGLLDALPPLGTPAPATLGVALVFIAAFAFVVIVQVTGLGAGSELGRRLQVHLRNGLYANALFDRLVGGLRRA